MRLHRLSHRAAARASLAAVCVVVAACAGGGDGPAPAPGAALAISPDRLPGGTVFAAYGATLFASGGAGQGYAWELSAGALPPGTAGIPATGASAVIAGTPTAPGTYGFTVRLRDSAGATVAAAYSVTIGPGGGPGPVVYATTLVNAPGPRGMHTAVWTGREMIVWGGVTFAAILNDGAAYDPATDSWRTISTAGAPTPRFLHTAVWTGTEMIVWGGSGGQGLLASGGAYDPVADRWRPLPAAGAPLPRALHTAVWTGAAMIVWAGEGTFPPPRPNSVDLVFQDGGAYDPASDRWFPISAAGPGARGHTAVWTGSEMITWGGRDAFALTLSALDAGGAYDPLADAWVPTPLAGAPAARAAHTAVWTGAGGMVVWGGRINASTSVATGGRFRPASRTWAATSTSGAPLPRFDHTAVWTGTEMMVWGGADDTGFLLGDGAAYRPGDDSWTPLAASFAPAPRAGHTAVWTGRAMIVWGGRGRPADTYFDTGAVYEP